jgi:hypothetical protein
MMRDHQRFSTQQAQRQAFERDIELHYHIGPAHGLPLAQPGGPAQHRKRKGLPTGIGGARNYCDLVPHGLQLFGPKGSYFFEASDGGEETGGVEEEVQWS